jgi:hypothetical protein
MLAGLIGRFDTTLPISIGEYSGVTCWKSVNNLYENMSKMGLGFTCSLAFRIDVRMFSKILLTVDALIIFLQSLIDYDFGISLCPV